MRSDRADDAQSEEEGGDADSLGLLLCDFPLRYLGPSTVAGEREAVACQTCGGPLVLVRSPGLVPRYHGAVESTRFVPKGAIAFFVAMIAFYALVWLLLMGVMITRG